MTAVSSERTHLTVIDGGLAYEDEDYYPRKRKLPAYSRAERRIDWKKRWLSGDDDDFDDAA